MTKKYEVPDEKEQKILRENGLDPDEYCVTYSDGKRIRMQCYKTRDIITIEKGDRKW